METNFQNELRGSREDAIAAQKQIEIYFKKYGETGHRDAIKHQLIFAGRIMNTIGKSDQHIKIYCEILKNVFGKQLQPKCSDSHWLIYVNNLRFFHYKLVCKKDYEASSEIYEHISFYSNYTHNSEVCLLFVNIFCYHFILQHSQLQNDKKQALIQAYRVVSDLTHLFQAMLRENKTSNLLYENILKHTLHGIFPNSAVLKIHELLKHLSVDKLCGMFSGLFELASQQKLVPMPTKDEFNQHSQYILETLNMFIIYDATDMFKLGLSLRFLEHNSKDVNLSADKPLVDIFVQLANYMKLIFTQTKSTEFQRLIVKYSKEFKSYFNLHYKDLNNQAWFSDLLLTFKHIHTQMLDTTRFVCFWKQMTTMPSYGAIFSLLLETMKMSPSISATSKLNTIKCCSSLRKHTIVSIANIALTMFAIYCQNVKNDDGGDAKILQNEIEQPLDAYEESIAKPLILLVNHAFKVIEKMDCITSTSEDIKILLKLFKQVAVSATTAKQAHTCTQICEQFLKIKNKLPPEEWPLLLRRVYKVSLTCITNNPQLITDIQMCYIVSLLDLSSEIDFTQIRGQISIYYSQNTQENKSDAKDKPTLPPPAVSHIKCLSNLYRESKNPLKPRLKQTRRQLLHWLESQHVMKYYKSNVILMESLIENSQCDYDGVIITRDVKLKSLKIPNKFTSIHQRLRMKTKDLAGLNRLDGLIYAHTCTKRLQEYQNDFKPAALESKELYEDKLDKLLLHKDMEKMTVQKELEYIRLGSYALQYFEMFYEKFDKEVISSDEALVDWEAIMEDLLFLAQFFQLRNYMDFSAKTWSLLYKIAKMLQAHYNALRALTFFCEYEMLSPLKLNVDNEIQCYFPIITHELDNLNSLSTRKQTYILIVTLQIAYYYARCSKHAFTEMLLEYVVEKHSELTERRGKYDLVMATLDVIKFRLLWRHIQTKGREDQAAENTLLDRCIISHIDQNLENLRQYVFSMGDGNTFNMMLCSLVKDLAECFANRLYENVLCPLFIAALKVCIQYGLALTMTQVTCTWMWINLQMEYVEEAQKKLKIIEYIMGIKTLEELSTNISKTTPNVQKTFGHIMPKTPNNIMELHHHTEMEATRRISQVHLSPIKTGKLQLSPDTGKAELTSYLNSEMRCWHKLPRNNSVEWIQFLVGCLNARLYFLVEDYEQLPLFYEKGSQWLKIRLSDDNKPYFKHIQLMAIRQYANYLRASGQYDKAIKCLTYGVEVCDIMRFDIDAVNCVNIKLQLLMTRKELAKSRGSNMTRESKVKLKFNFSSQEATAMKGRMKISAIASNSSSSSVENLKNSKSSASNSGASSPEQKRPKQIWPVFDISDDCIEILDSDEGSSSVKIAKADRLKNAKKRSVRTDKRSTSQEQCDNAATATICTNLRPTKSQLSSSSSSFTEHVQAKENIPQNELVKQLEKLELTEKTKNLKTKTKATTRKTPKPTVRQPTSGTVIILEDSPATQTVVKTRSRQRTKNTTDDVVVTSDATKRITRKRRNLVEEDKICESNIQSTPKVTTASAVISSRSVSIRRGQKI